MLINLVLLVDKNPVALPEWPLGPVFSSTPDVLDLNDLLAQQLPGNKADAWLFWDAALDLPNPSVIEATLAGSGDLWHAGLLLGMRGLPGIIDFVNPTWMLNCDPSPLLEATSWRVSLRACLVRTRVLQKMGFLRMDFLTLEAAALEWGHRCIRRGVVMRHLPALLPGIAGEQPSGVELPFEDQLRFMRYRFGYKWTNWSCLRAALSGFAPWGDIIRASLALRRFTGYQDPSPFRSPGERTALPGDNPAIKDNARVSVVIPTLERYAYLKMLLAQLRTQTQPPAEIIVVDQTPARQRLPKFYDEFKDLPLKLINLDQPGQCSSRNAGLQTTCGEFILFLDDDDEIPPELIAAHLAHLRQSHAAVSSGVANEVGAGPIPEDFTFQRVSDVFPTNNTLIYRSVLERSSLFDLAYERPRLLFTIHDLGISEQVQLRGKCPPQQVRDILQRSDVFLLSSLSEGISNALLEAMACGLPVVTTDCGGMREAVTDGVEGRVVPVRDVDAMVKALYFFWKNPSQRKKYGHASRKRVCLEYSLNSQIEQFVHLVDYVAKDAQVY